MKRGSYLWILMGALWFLNVTAVYGQEKSGFLLSAAAQGNHQMKMSNKKDGGDFEHVHALAMDAGRRSLFLGAHTGLFRSNDGGRSWNKLVLSAKQSSF